MVNPPYKSLPVDIPGLTGIRGSEEILLLGRLKWFLFSRLTIAILGIIAILIYQKTLRAFPLREFPPRLIAAYITLIFACFVNIIYLLSLKWRLIELKKLALIQISIDIFLITGLTYFTGGIGGSLFIYLYFASTLAAALLVSARSSFLFASLSTILLASVTITYFLGGHFQYSLPLLPGEYVRVMTRELRFILPYLFFFALVLHIIAFLAGRLALELNRERILKDEILQNIVNGLIVVDHNGKIVFYNTQALEMLNLSPRKELTGLRIEKALPGKKYEILQHALLNKSRITREIPLKNARGEDIYIEVTTSVLLGPHRQIRGVMAILNDVSLKKKVMEISKRAETLDTLSTMSVGVAHEVRNPLASIKSAIQELNEGDKFDRAEKKLMNIVVKESDRLNQIITEFLDFARERSVMPWWCNLVDLLEEIIALLKRKDLSKEIKVETELSGSLRCEADYEQLKQVFLNLGLNALEASSDSAKITFRGYFSNRDAPFQPVQTLGKEPASDNSGIMIEVIDAGVGIEPAHQARIYDPFFTTKPKGIGLGLSIANKIIQAHNGKIFVESKIGIGSKFSVWLPQRFTPLEMKKL